jgi:hypothetical protein
MWKRELLRNKLVALALLVGGVASTVIDHDVTFLVIALILAGPMFFAKENWIL